MKKVLRNLLILGFSISGLAVSTATVVSCGNTDNLNNAPIDNTETETPSNLTPSELSAQGQANKAAKDFSEWAASSQNIINVPGYITDGDLTQYKDKVSLQVKGHLENWWSANSSNYKYISTNLPEITIFGVTDFPPTNDISQTFQIVFYLADTGKALEASNISVKVKIQIADKQDPIVIGKDISSSSDTAKKAGQDLKNYGNSSNWKVDGSIAGDINMFMKKANQAVRNIIDLWWNMATTSNLYPLLDIALPTFTISTITSDQLPTTATDVVITISVSFTGLPDSTMAPPAQTIEHNIHLTNIETEQSIAHAAAAKFMKDMEATKVALTNVTNLKDFNNKIITGYQDEANKWLAAKNTEFSGLNANVNPVITANLTTMVYGDQPSVEIFIQFNGNITGVLLPESITVKPIVEFSSSSQSEASKVVYKFGEYTTTHNIPVYMRENLTINEFNTELLKELKIDFTNYLDTNKADFANLSQQADSVLFNLSSIKSVPVIGQVHNIRDLEITLNDKDGKQLVPVNLDVTISTTMSNSLSQASQALKQFTQTIKTNQIVISMTKGQPESDFINSISSSYQKAFEVWWSNSKIKSSYPGLFQDHSPISSLGTINVSMPSESVPNLPVSFTIKFLNDKGVEIPNEYQADANIDFNFITAQDQAIDAVKDFVAFESLDPVQVHTGIHATNQEYQDSVYIAIRESVYFWSVTESVKNKFHGLQLNSLAIFKNGIDTSGLLWPAQNKNDISSPINLTFKDVDGHNLNPISAAVLVNLIIDTPSQIEANNAIAMYAYSASEGSRINVNSEKGKIDPVAFNAQLVSEILRDFNEWWKSNSFSYKNLSQEPLTISHISSDNPVPNEKKLTQFNIGMKMISKDGAPIAMIKIQITVDVIN